jgi:hypothetical protein
MRGFILLVLCLMMAFPVMAQTPPPEEPDYTINNLRNRFTPDGLAVVEFEVWNRGGAASLPATALLNILSTGEEVARATVAPLPAQAIATVALTFQTSAFPPDSVQTFRVAVGVDEVEASGSANIRSNFAPLTLSFPALAEGSPTPLPPPLPTDNQDTERTILNDLRQRIPINWNDPVQVIIAAVIALALLVGVVLIFIVLRLLFSRAPHFEVWQPPYANTLFVDPNSPAGRRVGWQLNAQNASLPATATEGAWHIRKLPLGKTNDYLQGWRMTALRICQYDPYGRVNRSQVIATRRHVNRLNAARRGRAKHTPEQLSRQVRPIAHGLIGAFGKKVNERSSILPVAFDVQMTGKQSEVRIGFELYQRTQGVWVLADRWEPEMLIPGKQVEENFTYTLYGLRAGETFKTFRARFENDLTALLVELLNPPAAPVAPVPPPRADAPTDPHLSAVII